MAAHLCRHPSGVATVLVCPGRSNGPYHIPSVLTLVSHWIELSGTSHSVESVLSPESQQLLPVEEGVPDLRWHLLVHTSPGLFPHVHASHAAYFIHSVAHASADTMLSI